MDAVANPDDDKYVLECQTVFLGRWRARFDEWKLTFDAW
jgi:hypothetical protein